VIRGGIVDACANNLNQRLAVRLAGRAIVAVQGPIALADDTEPEPDVAIIRRRPVPCKEREAYAEDALLLIDRSDQALALRRGGDSRVLGGRLCCGKRRGPPRTRRRWLSRRQPRRCGRNGCRAG